ncbi:MAG: Maf family protein [Balneolaceae bacterium]
MPMKIILASQSPRRKKLLEQIGLTFEIIPSSVNEDISISDSNTMVQELALRKALDVAKSTSYSLIIGADTIVVHGNKVLGKPADYKEAFSTLSALSGNTHSVFTGVAFVETDNSGKIIAQHVFSVETKVTFGALATEEIEAYIATNSPMDKAGAYGIQDDWGAVFVERIEGDYNNVVGLPLFQLYKELKTFAPQALNHLVIPH